MILCTPDDGCSPEAAAFEQPGAKGRALGRPLGLRLGCGVCERLQPRRPSRSFPASLQIGAEITQNTKGNKTSH